MARVVAQHQPVELVAGVGRLQNRKLPRAFRVPRIAHRVPPVGHGGGLAVIVPGGVVSINQKSVAFEFGRVEL